MITEKPRSETAFYLRRLDRAARWLPRDQAAELHEQIESHLAETLPPDADPPAVHKALRDLGEPHLLVREAAGPHRRFRTRLGRVRWWTWTIAGVAAAALITSGTIAAVTLIPEYRAPNLECSCGQAFLYSADTDHARRIDAGSIQATEIVQRSNHQGFEFDVSNRGHVTQTVLGLPSEAALLGGFRHNYTLRIGTTDEHGFPLVNTTFTTGSVAIPPGQERTVTLSWNHLECSAPGVELTLTSVPLRVRIGPFTRTENIDLLGPIILKVPKPSATTPADRCVLASAHSH